ncbi:MAG: DNA adenine methylase [Treponema sp.]|jgi:adenine-specific DNA-methyltransferase|nr:DNA adenine methylase [Treponema sp.]
MSGQLLSPAVETDKPVSAIKTPPVSALHEKEEYLTRQLITCLGNKRALLGFIGNGIKKAQKRLNKNKLKTFDVFSGSGIVARYFKQFSGLLIVNDLEKYSTVINGCYLSNESELDFSLLREYYQELISKSNKGLIKGIISGLYAPDDDKNIKPHERVFYTSRNAMYIDTVRQLIGKIPQNDQKFFLAPLLSEASIHANTSGVFKGFYKNRETGIGQFGGKNRNALFRITGDINLPFPVFSNFNCDTVICNNDSNEVIKTLPEVDLAYLDPPYNQHPYGSNYFMLNLILDYKYPEKTSKTSGIPEDWNRSAYYKKNHALNALTHLVENINAKYLLISFNSEGFIGDEQMRNMLKRFGKFEVLETKYNVFRGSRNLKTREIHVREYLYLLEK